MKYCRRVTHTRYNGIYWKALMMLNNDFQFANFKNSHPGIALYHMHIYRPWKPNLHSFKMDPEILKSWRRNCAPKICTNGLLMLRNDLVYKAKMYPHVKKVVKITVPELNSVVTCKSNKMMYGTLLKELRTHLSLAFLYSKRQKTTTTTSKSMSTFKEIH